MIEWGQTASTIRSGQIFRLQIAEAMIKLGDQESMDASPCERCTHLASR